MKIKNLSILSWCQIINILEKQTERVSVMGMKVSSNHPSASIISKIKIVFCEYPPLGLTLMSWENQIIELEILSNLEIEQIIRALITEISSKRNKIDNNISLFDAKDDRHNLNNIEYLDIALKLAHEVRTLNRILCCIKEQAQAHNQDVINNSALCREIKILKEKIDTRDKYIAAITKQYVWANADRRFPPLPKLRK